MRAVALDKTDATKALSRIRRQWFAKRKSIAAIVKEVMTNEASVLMDSDAANKAADADMALQELGSDLIGEAYVTATVTVWDEDARAADERLRLVEKTIQGRDFTCIREGVNAVEAWLGSLPGQLYANVRQPPISTLNLAHMMPFSAVWAGPPRDEHLDAPALFVAKTEGSTPFRFSLHVGDVGHTLIVGPTGAGIHMIVPGGGLSPDGSRWVSSRPAFLLPVRVLGKLFRRLFLTRLTALHETGQLAFYGSMAHLADRRAFLRHLSPVRKKNWVVYAKPPFAGPETVLAYLSRYTHRVAISNSRLIRFDESGVTFRYKDYHRDSADRQQVMTLTADEFIRRFLLHVLPKGFHRIRHYGLLAGTTRKARLERARQLLGVAPPATTDAPADPTDVRPPCPCCGGHMVVVETFERWRQPRAPPLGAVSTGTTKS